MATSTLELGIDVGDLDRVIQVNCPPTVAAFLQRIGRTGRRPGSRRNCLFLAIDTGSLMWAAGLLHLWGQGYVEPVVAPPEPRHIVAQQLLALCLQEHRIGSRLWVQAWNGLAPFDRSAEPILRYLVEQGFVDQDGELLFIGPTAEQRFGYRHFMGMTAVFTAPPQFTVLSGRQEIGRTDPMLLTEKTDGPRLLLLGGRSWRVTWTDWKRRRCYVEPAEGGGKARWLTPGISGASFELARSVREVLLGADPPVALTQRAKRFLTEIRDEQVATVHPGGTVITRSGEDVRWWTWAGYRANATLAATLSHLTDGVQRFSDASIRMRSDLTHEMWKAGSADATERLCLPTWISERSPGSSSTRRCLNAWRRPRSPLALQTWIPPREYSPSPFGSLSSLTDAASCWHVRWPQWSPLRNSEPFLVLVTRTLSGGGSDPSMSPMVMSRLRYGRARRRELWAGQGNWRSARSSRAGMRCRRNWERAIANGLTWRTIGSWTGT